MYVPVCIIDMIIIHILFEEWKWGQGGMQTDLAMNSMIL